MAKDAFFADWTREIRVGLIFVAGRQTVVLTAGVESDRRLEQVSADIDEIAAGMGAGADDIVDAVVVRVAAIFPALPITAGGGMHGDLRAVRRDGAIWLLPGAAQRVGHGRAGISFNLRGMAERATARVGRLTGRRLRKGKRIVAGGRCVGRLVGQQSGANGK